MTEKTLFKTLTQEQEKEFRQWTRDNYTTSKANNDLNNPLWHPTIKDEFKLLLALDSLIE